MDLEENLDNVDKEEADFKETGQMTDGILIKKVLTERIK